MWSMKKLLALGACVLAICASTTVPSVRAHDVDEFEDIDPVASMPTDTTPDMETPVTTTTTTATDVPLKRPVTLEDLKMEFGAIGFMAIYIACYYIGRSQNYSIAKKWVDLAQPTLEKNFAYTSNTASTPVGLTPESADNYKYYCTGRRYCSRFVTDFQLASRQDLFSRITSLVFRKNDYVSFDISMNPEDMDPMVLAVCKKLEFNRLTKLFPELLGIGKRVSQTGLPESYCVTVDSIETPKIAFTTAMINTLKKMEPFLQYMVVSDVSQLPIVGIPKTHRQVMHLQFQLRNGNSTLDPEETVQFALALIDAVSEKIKLTPEGKRIAKNKRTKYELETSGMSAAEHKKMNQQLKVREKKKKQYESLSYEEQQKLDELNQKKSMRKRLGRKKK